MGFNVLCLSAAWVGKLRSYRTKDQGKDEVRGCKSSVYTTSSKEDVGILISELMGWETTL